MTETERRDWQEYRETGDVGVRNRLVERHLGLVHHFAHRMEPRTGGRVERDDLLGAGSVGLLNAVESFDPERGCRFSTFAASRVRGAMLDEMRRRDVAPRSVRRKQRRMERARDRLTAVNGRAPNHPELAEVLGVDAQTLWRWKGDVERSQRVSLSELVPGGPRPRPEPGGWAGGETADERLERRERLERLERELPLLPERDRLILELYDRRGLTLREVGERLGVSESRVSQLRTRALGRLRDRLGGALAA